MCVCGPEAIPHLVARTILASDHTKALSGASVLVEAVLVGYRFGHGAPEHPATEHHSSS